MTSVDVVARSPGRTPETAGDHTGSSSPRKIFIVVAAGVFLGILDLFIVNIALPAIQKGFGNKSVSEVSWVLNAYAIVFAALLVPAGKLGDVIGRRKVFAFGLLVFGLGSALCAAAPSLEFLIAARLLQAVGAAAVTPTSLGLLLPSLPPERRAGAIGAWAAIGAVGAASGPPLGGLLTQISWHWIFIVNVPLALGTFVAAQRVLPEIRDPNKPPLPDLLGTVLLIASVASATLGLVEGSAWSWDGRVIGCFVGSTLLAGLFVARSRKQVAPVLELSILRVRAFALSSLSATLFFAAFGAMLISNVIFLTEVWHYSALRAGLELTPGPLAAAAVAPLAGRLARRVGPGFVGALGAMFFVFGSVLWIVLIGTTSDYIARFLPGMVMGGIGVGFALPSFTIAATRTLPPERLATGIGAQTMFRQIGGTLGVAAFVAILGSPSGTDVLTAFNHTRWFMVVAAALAAGALGSIGRPATVAPTSAHASAPVTPKHRRRSDQHVDETCGDIDGAEWGQQDGPDEAQMVGDRRSTASVHYWLLLYQHKELRFTRRDAAERWARELADIGIASELLWHDEHGLSPGLFLVPEAELATSGAEGKAGRS